MFDALGERMSAIEQDMPERLERLREIEHHVAGELAMAQAEYRGLRIAGAIGLAAGLALTTWGNFVN
jgi:hypothetical protein